MGFYDSEGSVYKENGERYRLSLTQHKREDLKENAVEYFNQIKQMLLEFDVKTSPIKICKGNKRKDNTYSINLRFIIEKSSFQKFYDNIGFMNNLKQEKLLNALKK